MAKTNREGYKQARDRLITSNETRDISDQDYDAILEFLDAKDPERLTTNDHTGDKPKSYGTLKTYAGRLNRFAVLADFNLTDIRHTRINQLCDDMHIGDIEGVKDGGLSKGSVKNYQGILRKFYQYHSDLGVNPEKIAMFTNNGTSVDERDIFDKDDIQALRDAASHKRDRALIDILLYTGQRIGAVLNLRIKDFDFQRGIFYLNDSADGNKSATGKRPLLYAAKSCREWYQSHPAKENPEAFFITHKNNWDGKKFSGGEKLDSSSVYEQLQYIGNRSGVEKPVNAHNFRHTFVTICKRDYEMDNDTIKQLIGHRPDSQVMETTYSHLTDDDAIEKAEEATGIREKEPESPLTPDSCETCGEPIPMENAKACPSCGTLFTPDAQEAKNQMEDTLFEGVAEADKEEEKDAVLALREFLKENPSMVADILNDD